MEILDLSALALACKSLSEAVKDSKNQSFKSETSGGSWCDPEL